MPAYAPFLPLENACLLGVPDTVTLTNPCACEWPCRESMTQGGEAESLTLVSRAHDPGQLKVPHSHQATICNRASTCLACHFNQGQLPLTDAALDVAPLLGGSPWSGPDEFPRQPVFDVWAPTPTCTSGAVCMWGTACGLPISELSAIAIMRHLKQYHHAELHPLCLRIRSVCQWRTSNGSPCGNPLLTRNLGKHIATVHLRATTMTCPGCGWVFTRPDSLKCHLRNGCKRG